MSWKINPEVSYEVGVYVGDGNMYSYGRTHRVTYSGNLENEREFYKKLSELFKKTFGLNVVYDERPEDNTVLIRINSKELLKFKNEVLKLPMGSKDEIGIPKQIMDNNQFVKRFIRGLGDTDFSLSFKKNRKGVHKEPRLEWYTKSERLSKQVEKILKKFGFTLSTDERKGKYHGFLLRMYGKRNLELWLKTFGFSNDWTNLKIEFWKKFGYFEIRKSYTELQKLLDEKS